MKKRYLGVFFWVLHFLSCQTSVVDHTDAVDIAFMGKISRSNDTATLLYMDVIDSSLVQNIQMVEYKAKVNDVFRSIVDLTNIGKKYGGYISRGKTKNDRLAVQVRKVQRDSSAMIVYYQTKSTIMIRIPHFYIDSALKEIDEHLMHIDYKYSKVNDSAMERYIACEFLGNADQRKKKEGGYFYANYDANYSYDKMVDEYVNNYGAIILSIYQNPQVKVEKFWNAHIPRRYEHSFWYQTKLEWCRGLQFIKKGWYIVLRCWPILTLILLSLIILWINNKVKIHE